MFLYSRVCIFVLAASYCAAASVNIKGELACANCLGDEHWEINVRQARNGTGQTVYPDSNGRFDLNVEGDVELTVTDSSGGVVRRDLLTLTSNQAPLVVNVRRDSSTPRTAATGVVSLRRLQHKAHKAARKEFEKSLKAADPAIAVQHLKNAVTLDPEYAEAWNNLGAKSSRLGQQQDAEAYYRKALEADPSAPLVWSNLAMVLLTVHRAQEAEMPARRCLELDPSYQTGHFMLGLALAQQGKFNRETLQHLEAAQDAYADARLLVAEVAVRSGDVARARRQLQSYISAPDSPHKDRAAQWLKTLK